jgi:hypothetical protein
LAHSVVGVAIQHDDPTSARLTRNGGVGVADNCVGVPVTVEVVGAWVSGEARLGGRLGGRRGETDGRQQDDSCTGHTTDESTTRRGHVNSSSDDDK